MSERPQMLCTSQDAQDPQGARKAIHWSNLMQPVDRPELTRLDNLSPTFLRVILEDLQHELETIDQRMAELINVRLEIRARIHKVRYELLRRRRARTACPIAWPDNNGGAVVVLAS